MRPILIAVLIAMGPAPLQAVTSLYIDRASFEQAAGVRSVEDFETCSDSPSLAVNQVLNAKNPGSCAMLVAGFSLAPSLGGTNYVALPGQSSNPSIAIGVDSNLGEATRITFDTGSTAFAADLFQNYGGGDQSTSAARFRIRLFTLEGALIDDFAVDVLPSGGSFFGVTSSEVIGSVEVGQSDGYAVLDNITFSTMASVPEISTWGMLLIGFGTVGGMLRGARSAGLKLSRDSVARI